MSTPSLDFVIAEIVKAKPNQILKECKLLSVAQQQELTSVRRVVSGASAQEARQVGLEQASSCV